MEKLEERISKIKRKPQTVINQTSYGAGHALVKVRKPNTFKIPTFDGTGLWELYHKPEATVAHNQWTDTKKTVALTVELKGATQQELAALSLSDIIKYATLVNCLEQRCGQKYLASVKEGELKKRIQKCWEGLQDYAADIRRLTQKTYPSMDPDLEQNAAVDSFVDGI